MAKKVKQLKPAKLAAGQEAWLVFRYELIAPLAEGGLQFPQRLTRSEAVGQGLQSLAAAGEQLFVNDDVFQVADVVDAGNSVLGFKLSRRVVLRQTGRLDVGKVVEFTGPVARYSKAIALTAPDQQWLLLEENGDVARSANVLLQAVRTVLATAMRVAGAEYVANARLQLDKAAFFDWYKSVDRVTVLEFSSAGKNLPAAAGNTVIANIKADLHDLRAQIAGKRSVYAIHQPEMTEPVVAALADTTATQDQPFVARGAKKQQKLQKFDSEDPSYPHRLYVHAEQSLADKVVNLTNKLRAYLGSRQADQGEPDGDQ